MAMGGYRARVFYTMRFVTNDHDTFYSC